MTKSLFDYISTQSTVVIRLKMVTTLNIFRFLVVLKLVVAMIAAAMLGIDAGLNSAAVILPSIIATGLIAIAAWLKPLEKILGARFFPALLTAAIVEQNTEFIYLQIVRPFQTILFGSVMSNLILETRRGEMFFLVLVLTVLAAWQYGYRGANASLLFASALHIAISVLAVAVGWVNNLSLLFLPLQIILLALITYIVAFLVEQQRAQQRELETAHRQLQQFAAMAEQLARSRERNRVARDLHDTLAHSLTGLVVQLQAARSLLPQKPDDARATIAQAEKTARSGLDEARLAIRDLRSSPIASLGLIGALKQEISVFEQEGAASVTLAIAEPLPPLRAEQEETLWRVAQEALRNIARHANAQNVKIELGVVDGALKFSIADDGIGFDVRTLPENHFGVIGMRERVALIGGQLCVESAPGQGTRVHCELPITNYAEG
ncbi:two-component system, NarL family, sensor histidine kinase YdfH [Anaerolineae bacterium]|nr:two-component system, NarL family, sensor histidine kinase YdfH [Anaerolineae bacterium]